MDLGTVDVVTLGQRKLERFEEVSVCYSSYRMTLREVQAVLTPCERAKQSYVVLFPVSFTFDLEVLQDSELVNQLVLDENLRDYHKVGVSLQDWGWKILPLTCSPASSSYGRREFYPLSRFAWNKKCTGTC